jgi:hypothetical protein
VSLIEAVPHGRAGRVRGVDTSTVNVDCAGSLRVVSVEPAADRTTDVTARCGKCKGEVRVTMGRGVASSGTGIISRARTTVSPKGGKGFNTTHLHAVAGGLLAGGSPEVIMAAHNADMPMSGPRLNKSTVDRASVHVWRAADKVGRASVAAAAKRTIERCRDYGEPSLVVAIDGAWAQRRQSSYHETVVLDVESRDVVALQVLSQGRVASGSKDFGKRPSKKAEDEGERVEIYRFNGNYEGTPKGMEATATKTILDQIDPELVEQMSAFVGDEDGSLAKILRGRPDRLKDVEVLCDPGHYCGNLKKRVLKAIKTTFKVTAVPARMALLDERLRKWVMIAILRASRETGTREEAIELFKHIMQFSAAHFFESECAEGCPCTRDKELQAKSSRKWVNPGCSRDGSLVTQIKEMISRCVERAPALVHGYSSGICESFHNERVRLTDKRVAYWKTFEARTYAAAGEHNLGSLEFRTRVYRELGLEPSESVAATWAERDRRREVEREKADSVQARKARATVALQHKKRISAAGAKERAARAAGGAAYRSGGGNSDLATLQRGGDPEVEQAKVGRKRRRDQAALAAAHAGGDANVKCCNDCGKFWLMQHKKCKAR